MYEPYLNQIHKLKHRVSLTKLRLSNHNLQVETGRYNRPHIHREERFCPFSMSLGVSEVWKTNYILF
jgi:phosphopantetheinyl transferase